MMPEATTGWLAYVSLGSNEGDRWDNLQQAHAHLQTLPEISVLRASRIYQSAPVGMTEGADFYNQVLELRTNLAPDTLLTRLLEAETQLGRVRDGIRDSAETPKPRKIDIDLLIFENRIVYNAHVMVPHPRMHERLFALLPMCDLAPDLVHPVKGQTMAELMHEVKHNPATAIQRACVVDKPIGSTNTDN